MIQKLLRSYRKIGASTTAFAFFVMYLIHPIDPCGNKVGGIDTHVRMMIAHAPEEWTVLFIGVDGRGDCRFGELRRLQIDRRTIEFLPLLQYPDERVHEAAPSLFASLTLQFSAP